MKKFIFSAVAAGALAFGSTASAQDLGAILSNILGFGQPNYGAVEQGVVVTPHGQVHTDAYGRRVYVDPNGRQYGIPQGAEVANDAYGRPMYRDAYGRWAYVVSGSPYDRDGDGVADNGDRWPDDRRRW